MTWNIAPGRMFLTKILPCRRSRLGHRAVCLDRVRLSGRTFSLRYRRLAQSQLHVRNNRSGRDTQRRYFLYKSIWNTKKRHFIFFLTGTGKEEKGRLPGFRLYSYPSAELFVNGKSYGKREKNDSTLQNRYRLMWMNVKYEPGIVRLWPMTKREKQQLKKRSEQQENLTGWY